MDRTFISHSQIWPTVCIIVLLKWVSSESRHHVVCAEWMGSRRSFGPTDCRAVMVRSGSSLLHWLLYLYSSWNHENIFCGSSTLFHQHYFPKEEWSAVEQSEGVKCAEQSEGTNEVTSQRGCWGLGALGEGAQGCSSKEVQTHSGGWWIWQLILVCLTAGAFFASFITSGEVFHTCAM